jgi:hypothetical protein
MDSLARRIGADFLGLPPDQTEIQTVENRFLNRWQFWRVSDGHMPPRTVFVATSGDKAERVSFETGLRGVLQGDQPRIASAQDAIEFIDFFLEITRPTSELLRSTRNIAGADENDLAAVKGLIGPPQAIRQTGHYVVEGWLWDNGEVQFARFQIGPWGIESQLDPKRRRLGIPITID